MEDIAKRPKPPPALSYACKICAKTFKSATLHDKHASLHVSTSKCEMCDKQFLRPEHLRLHRAIHSQSALKCRNCNQQFLSQNNLRFHQKICYASPNKEQSTCEGNAVQQEQDYRSESEPEVGDIYSCELCEFTSDSLECLETHATAHIMNPSFGCDLCGAKCESARLLKEHKLVHTSDTYNCDICGDEFRSVPALNGHRLRHFSSEFQRSALNKMWGIDKWKSVPVNMSAITELKNTNINYSRKLTSGNAHDANNSRLESINNADGDIKRKRIDNLLKAYINNKRVISKIGEYKLGDKRDKTISADNKSAQSPSRVSKNIDLKTISATVKVCGTQHKRVIEHRNIKERDIMRNIVQVIDEVATNITNGAVPRNTAANVPSVATNAINAVVPKNIRANIPLVTQNAADAKGEVILNIVKPQTAMENNRNKSTPVVTAVTQKTKNVVPENTAANNPLLTQNTGAKNEVVLNIVKPQTTIKSNSPSVIQNTEPKVVLNIVKPQTTMENNTNKSTPVVASVAQKTVNIVPKNTAANVPLVTENTDAKNEVVLNIVKPQTNIKNNNPSIIQNTEPKVLLNIVKPQTTMENNTNKSTPVVASVAQKTVNIVPKNTAVNVPLLTENTNGKNEVVLNIVKPQTTIKINNPSVTQNTINASSKNTVVNTPSVTQNTEVNFVLKIMNPQITMENNINKSAPVVASVAPKAVNVVPKNTAVNVSSGAQNTDGHVVLKIINPQTTMENNTNKSPPLVTPVAQKTTNVAANVPSLTQNKDAKNEVLLKIIKPQTPKININPLATQITINAAPKNTTANVPSDTKVIELQTAMKNSSPLVTQNTINVSKDTGANDILNIAKPHTAVANKSEPVVISRVRKNARKPGFVGNFVTSTPIRKRIPIPLIVPDRLQTQWGKSPKIKILSTKIIKHATDLTNGSLAETPNVSGIDPQSSGDGPQGSKFNTPSSPVDQQVSDLQNFKVGQQGADLQTSTVDQQGSDLQTSTVNQQSCEIRPDNSKFNLLISAIDQLSSELYKQCSGVEQQSCDFYPQSSIDQQSPDFNPQSSAFNQQSSVSNPPHSKLKPQISESNSLGSQSNPQSSKFYPQSSQKDLGRIQRSSELNPDSSTSSQRSSKLNTQSSELNEQSTERDSQCPGSDQQNSKFNPQRSVVDQKSSKFNPQSSELNTQSPKKYPQSPERDQLSSKLKLQGSKSNSRSSAVDQQSSKLNPQSSESNAQNSKMDSQSSEKHQQSFEFNPQSCKIDPQTSELDPRSTGISPPISVINPRSSEIDPQTSKSNARSSKIDLHSSKIDPQISEIVPQTSKINLRSSKVVPQKIEARSSKIDIQSSKIDTQSPKIDPRTSEVSPRNSKINLGSSKMDPRRSKSDPRRSKIDLRRSKINIRSSKIDPRISEASPRNSKINLRSCKIDPRRSKIDFRSSKNDLRISEISPRNSKVNLRSSKIDPRKSKIDIRSSTTNLRSSQTDTQTSKTDPQPSKTDPQPSKSNPRSSEIDPRSSKIDPRSSKINPRRSKTNPRSSRIDPRCSKIDPRRSKIDPRRSKTDSRRPKIDPRRSKIDPLTSKINLRSSKINLRSSKINLRSSKIDPQRSEVDPHRSEVDPQNSEVDTQNFKVDPRSSEVEPHSSEVYPNSSKVDPHSCEVDPHSSEVDPNSSKVDPHSGEVDPQSSEVDPHSSQIDSQSSHVDSQTKKVDLQSSEVDPRSSEVDPQSVKIDPGNFEVDPQSGEIDIQNCEIDLQDCVIVPQSCEIDLQSCIIVPQSYEIDPQSGEIYPQNLDIDIQSCEIVIQSDGTNLQGYEVIPQSPEIHIQNYEIDIEGGEINSQNSVIESRNSDSCVKNEVMSSCDMDSAVSIDAPVTSSNAPTEINENKHSVDMKGVHVCFMCNAKFTCPQTLDIHTRFHKDEDFDIDKLIDFHKTKSYKSINSDNPSNKMDLSIIDNIVGGSVEIIKDIKSDTYAINITPDMDERQKITENLNILKEAIDECCDGNKSVAYRNMIIRNLKCQLKEMVENAAEVKSIEDIDLDVPSKYRRWRKPKRGATIRKRPGLKQRYRRKKKVPKRKSPVMFSMRTRSASRKSKTADKSIKIEADDHVHTSNEAVDDHVDTSDEAGDDHVDTSNEAVDDHADTPNETADDTTIVDETNALNNDEPQLIASTRKLSLLRVSDKQGNIIMNFKAESKVKLDAIYKELIENLVVKPKRVPDVSMDQQQKNKFPEIKECYVQLERCDHLLTFNQLNDKRATPDTKQSLPNEIFKSSQKDICSSGEPNNHGDAVKSTGTLRDNDIKTPSVRKRNRRFTRTPKVHKTHMRNRYQRSMNDFTELGDITVMQDRIKSPRESDEHVTGDSPNQSYRTKLRSPSKIKCKRWNDDWEMTEPINELKATVDEPETILDESKTIVDESKTIVDKSKTIVDESKRSVGRSKIITEESLNLFLAEHAGSFYESYDDDCSDSQWSNFVTNNKTNMLHSIGPKQTDQEQALTAQRNTTPTNESPILDASGEKIPESLVHLIRKRIADGSDEDEPPIKKIEISPPSVPDKSSDDTEGPPKYYFVYDKSAKKMSTVVVYDENKVEDGDLSEIKIEGVNEAHLLTNESHIEEISNIDERYNCENLHLLAGVIRDHDKFEVPTIQSETTNNLVQLTPESINTDISPNITEPIETTDKTQNVSDSLNTTTNLDNDKNLEYLLNTRKNISNIIENIAVTSKSFKDIKPFDDKLSKIDHKILYDNQSSDPIWNPTNVPPSRPTPDKNMEFLCEEFTEIHTYEEFNPNLSNDDNVSEIDFEHFNHELSKRFAHFSDQFTCKSKEGSINISMDDEMTPEVNISVSYGEAVAKLSFRNKDDVDVPKDDTKRKSVKIKFKDDESTAKLLYEIQNKGLKEAVSEYSGARARRAAYNIDDKLFECQENFREEEEPLYKCSQCDKRFVHLFAQKFHEGIHIKRNTYSCKKCGWATNDNKQFALHTLVHLSKNPFMCDICGLQFVNSHVGKGHRLQHEYKLENQNI